MLRTGLVALGLVALLLSACAPAAEKAVEQIAGVTVEKTGQKGESVTIKGKEGQSVTISGEAPDELKGFQVPQGFALESSGSVSSGGEKVVTGSWKGKGEVKAVAEFYKKSMAGQGWKEEFSFEAGDGAQGAYTKDGQKMIINVAKAEGDIELTVMLTK
ncbi:MAG TPA: hypothetical protein VJO15_00840 [Dehalococcoidia bacterium]|nr:hypothetical protein [Dehalococcoidia bacterium]